MGVRSHQNTITKGTLQRRAYLARNAPNTMSETFNPFSDAYAAAHLADEARSLSSTLLLAPAQEPRRLTALRQWLSQIADALAVKCAEPAYEEQRAAYKSLLSSLRYLGQSINASNHLAPSGLDIVLRAFQEQLHPEAVVILSHIQANMPGNEEIGLIERTLKDFGIINPLVNGSPSKAFVLYGNFGEQDNVLAAPLHLAHLYCNLVTEALGEKAHSLSIQAVAARALGPAYVFAHCLDGKTWGGNPKYLSQSVWDALADGWLEHPVIGNHLGTALLNCPSLKASPRPNTPEWKALCEKIPAYTPAQFDAEVPILWERLKQLLPPNELGMDEVESENPASLVSIINAGWSFYLLYMDDLYKILGSKTAQDRYDAKMVLNRLLTKGVELSQITQNWRTARKAIGQ